VASGAVAHIIDQVSEGTYRIKLPKHVVNIYSAAIHVLTTGDAHAKAALSALYAILWWDRLLATVTCSRLESVFELHLPAVRTHPSHGLGAAPSV